MKASHPENNKQNDTSKWNDIANHGSVDSILQKYNIVKMTLLLKKSLWFNASINIVINGLLHRNRKK